MSVTVADLKVLWGRSGGTCAMCRTEITADGSDGHARPLGEQAHIVAQSPKGPRGDADLSEGESDRARNLILLCPKCHTEVDKDSSAWPPERLREVKEAHEAWVRSMGRERPMSEFSGEIELDASDTDLAEGMHIETPTKLSGKVKVTARNVGTARGISIQSVPPSPAQPPPAPQAKQPQPDRPAQQATVIAAFTCPSCAFSAGMMSVVGGPAACPKCGTPID
jgi:hypothetical protein